MIDDIAAEFREDPSGDWIRLRVRGGMYPLGLDEARTLRRLLGQALAQAKAERKATAADPWRAAVDRMVRVIRAHLLGKPADYDPNTDPMLEAAVERACPGFSGGMWEAAVREARAPAARATP